MSPIATPPDETFGPISRTDIVRYAGASTDFNPMHHDDEFARAAGMPSVFAHGMLSAGLLASHLERWVGPRGRVESYRVRFASQVWPGDVLVPRVEVTRQDDARASVDVALETTSGDIAIVGTAELWFDNQEEQG